MQHIAAADENPIYSVFTPFTLSDWFYLLRLMQSLHLRCEQKQKQPGHLVLHFWNMPALQLVWIRCHTEIAPLDFAWK